MLNLSGLKSVIPATSSESPPTTTAQIDPPAFEPEGISPVMKKFLKAQKRWRSRCGSERSRLEQFSHKLDLAQQTQTQRIQQNVVDEHLDVEVVSAAIAADTANIHALQTAVNTLSEQLHNSELELKNADDAVQREQLREELMQLQVDGRTVDECVASLRKALHRVCPRMDAARAHGYELINWKLNDAQTFFRQWLLDSCGEMPGCKTGLDVFLKRECWSETLPQPDQADHVRLTPYPAPTPIPTWQKAEA